MSAFKSYILILLLFVSGCTTQQMSGSSQSTQPSSTPSGMPSSSSSGGMPSSSSTPSGMPSSSSSGGMPSSSSTPSGMPSSSSSGGMPSSSSSNQGSEDDNENSEVGQSSISKGGSLNQQEGQSASSVFDESLGDFDNDMAEERELIAAANQDSNRMSEAIIDQIAISEAKADSIYNEQTISNKETDADADKDAESKKQQIIISREDMPDEYTIKDQIVRDKNGNIVIEDDIASQIREAAELEEDKNIRNALWEEWKKYISR